MTLSTARRTECYLDTSALIAFLDKSDTFHPLFRRLFSKPPPLVTSSLVIMEAHGWFLRRYDQHKAIQLLLFFAELPTTTVEAFDTGGLASASAIARKFNDQKLTLADAHGLAIIEKREIATCWSTDWHFTLTGAALVI